MLEYDGVVISRKLPEMIIARSDAAARRDAFSNLRGITSSPAGKSSTNQLRPYRGETFSPSTHSGRYKLRARASGGAKLPTLNPFSDVLEFAGGKFETLPGCLARVTFNQICTRFRGCEDKILIGILYIYTLRATASALLT